MIGSQFTTGICFCKAETIDIKGFIKFLMQEENFHVLMEYRNYNHRERNIKTLKVAGWCGLGLF